MTQAASTPPPLRRNRPLMLVLAIGVAVRAVLIPITHGQDFVVWDLAARGTLHGTNVYAHHPHYPGGPYAYFPLFLYLELPFRWLALHGAGSFVVWGKLPIAAADLAAALVVAAELRRRGAPPRLVAGGAALWFLNPLVLYNSAYYGRFDSLGCALLGGALYALARTGSRGRAWPLWFGLAVAAKTFPAFTVLGLLRAADGARLRLIAAAVAIPLLVTVPYLGAPHAFVHDLLVHDLVKSPQGLSWQYLLTQPVGLHAVKQIGYVLLAAFVLLALVLTRVADLWLYCAAVLCGFLLTSKLVLEQYLTWPMVFLVVIGLTGPVATRRAAMLVLVAFTVIGVVDNETWHPLGRESWLGIVVAALSVALVGVALLAQPSEDAAKVSQRAGTPVR